MRVTVEPLENKFTIDGLTLKDIDNIIEALNTVKSNVRENMETLKEIDKNHAPTEAELQGAVGYHPPEELKTAKAKMVIEDSWGSKTIQFESVSCRSALNNELFSDTDKPVFIDEEAEEEYNKREEFLKSDEAPDEIEIEHSHILKESTFEIVPNLQKANRIIKDMYLNDSDDLIGAGIEWKPCGGTYVAKAIGRYFIVEVNMDGLAIKEVSEKFYNCFVEEFHEEHNDE